MSVNTYWYDVAVHKAILELYVITALSSLRSGLRATNLTSPFSAIYAIYKLRLIEGTLECTVANTRSNATP